MGTSDITVTALTATPGIGHVALKFTTSDPRNGAIPNIALSAVEVHASATNDRSGASKIDEGRDKALHTALTEGATYYYWARARNNLGNVGDWYPSGANAGIPATVSFAADFTLVNGVIVPSVSGGALTIAIKQPDGVSDPTASNPARVTFRGQYSGTTTLLITSALSLTISSGSTLGATSNEPLRVYVVALKDGSNVVLGAINCLITGSAFIYLYPLNDHYQYSPTVAEGGAGGADTAGDIYSAASVNQVSKRVLGFLTWESGLTTAGTWDALPDGNELFGKDSKLPGQEVSSGARLRNDLQTFLFGGGGGATPLPIDDTIPAVGESFIFVDCPITPRSAANILQIEADVSLAPDAANEYVAVIAQISGSSASAIAWERSVGANLPVGVKLFHQQRSGSVVTQNWQCRIGYSAASGTVYAGGQSGSRRFGGVLPSSFRVREITG